MSWESIPRYLTRGFSNQDLIRTLVNGKCGEAVIVADRGFESAPHFFPVSFLTRGEIAEHALKRFLVLVMRLPLSEVADVTIGAQFRGPSLLGFHN